MEMIPVLSMGKMCMLRSDGLHHQRAVGVDRPRRYLVTHALQDRQRLAGYVLNGDERAAVNDDAVQGNLVRSDDQGEREGGERLFLEGKQIN